MSFTNGEPAAVRLLKENNRKVFQAMNDFKRYQDFIKKIQSDSRLKDNEKQAKLTALQDAIKTASIKYRDTADKFLNDIDTAAKELGTTEFVQKCSDAIQDVSLAQLTEATALMNLPRNSTAEYNKFYLNFEKALDAAYNKIGAKIPK